MKRLSPDNIFSLFDKLDEEILKEEGQEELLKEDYVLLGLAIKGIENYVYLNEIYSNRYGEKYNAIAEGIKNKYFSKMYSYIDEIQLNKLEDFLGAVESLGSGTVVVALEELSLYFVGREEYEKCAKIKKLTDLVKSFF